MTFEEYIKSESLINNLTVDVVVDDETADGIRQYYSYWESLLDEKFRFKKDKYSNSLQDKQYM